MTRAEKRRRRIIKVEVELSCAPGTTRLQARREARWRLNDDYWKYNTISIRAKRIK